MYDVYNVFKVYIYLHGEDKNIHLQSYLTGMYTGPQGLCGCYWAAAGPARPAFWNVCMLGQSGDHMEALVYHCSWSTSSLRVQKALMFPYKCDAEAALALL